MPSRLYPARLSLLSLYARDEHARVAPSRRVARLTTVNFYHARESRHAVTSFVRLSSKFASDLGALSTVLELVKYNQHRPILSYGLSESKYPGRPLFSAILVTPEAYESQP